MTGGEELVGMVTRGGGGGGGGGGDGGEGKGGLVLRVCSVW